MIYEYPDSTREQMHELNQRVKRGRLTLVLIASAFIVPVLIAAWMQRVAFEEGVWGGTQHGTLIEPPLALRDFHLPAWQGQDVTLAELKGKWTMLYMAPDIDQGPAECAAECRQAVYYMRQIRLALGKDMKRVQRILLVTPGSGWLEEIAKEYEGMRIVFDAGAEDSLLQQFEPVQPGIYIVDPLGNAMMIYALQTDPRDILKDLKKLLRNSKVG
jgi:cytochrome oxidase Cu insertion factor (SCO1/SenC/PrrC family)